MTTTSIVRAIRDGILTAPDGTKYRLHRGRTLGDARHPAVIAYPDNFEPIEVELFHDDELAGPGHLEDSAGEELAELQASLDEANEAANAYASQLALIASLLVEHGVAPAEEDRVPGWVAVAVAGLLADVSRETSPEAATEAEDIPAPRAVRKPRAKTVEAG